MMKYTIAILQLLIIFTVIYFCYENYQNTSNINFIYNSELTVISTGIFAISAYLLGLITGILQTLAVKNTMNKQVEFYSKKNEKLSLMKETELDNKEALERKIATLEIALQNALKNKKTDI